MLLNKSVVSLNGEHEHSGDNQKQQRRDRCFLYEKELSRGTGICFKDLTPNIQLCDQFNKYFANTWLGPNTIKLVFSTTLCFF